MFHSLDCGATPVSEAGCLREARSPAERPERVLEVGVTGVPVREMNTALRVNGPVILTGSQHFLLSEKINQSLLRTSYIIELVQPHHRNFRKRLVKTPKLYFNDSGLMCHLLGIATTEQLRHHPLRGAIFETFVVSEVRKAFLHQGERPPVSFWRDTRGHEVDLIVERGGALVPFEIKAGRTVATDFFAGLDYFTRISKGSGGVLVYGGEESYMRQGHLVCSWAAAV